MPEGPSIFILKELITPILKERKYKGIWQCKIEYDH
jgi:hypothetical protein